jgi:hypothetical protein
MRADQLRLDQVRERIKRLQDLEKKLEDALTREYEDMPVDERVARACEFDELMGIEEEDKEIPPEDELLFQLTKELRDKLLKQQATEILKKKLAED